MNGLITRDMHECNAIGIVLLFMNEYGMLYMIFQQVSSLKEEHLSSEGDPDDVPSDKETHVADDDIDDPPEVKV